MDLDTPTLMVAGAFVALMCGVFLICAWYQNREMTPVLWWAAGDIVMAGAVLLLAVGGDRGERPLVVSALTLLTLSGALMLTSARLFCGRPMSWPLLAAGPAISLGAAALPAAVYIPGFDTAVSSLIQIAYLALTAGTIVLAAPAGLRSRLPLATVISLHAAVLMIGAANMVVGHSLDFMPDIETLFGIIHFEAIIFLVGTTAFVFTSMREAGELRLRTAAETDPLTGIANRRAFMSEAERLRQFGRQTGAPFALAIFDLDRFKSINDSFGHGVGDKALQLFADICRRSLRPSDMIARIGGEEFAALLPGSGAEAGAAMADRIRKAFATAAFEIDAQTIAGTVSAGIAVDEGNGTEIVDLMKNADSALYRAKLMGRNRVERYTPDRSRELRVLRIA